MRFLVLYICVDSLLCLHGMCCRVCAISVEEAGILLLSELGFGGILS